MTTTDSAQVTPTAGGPVAVTRAERVAARAPAAVMAERRGWLILWLAFATFCALVFAAFKFTVEYVRTAEVDQGARVSTSRGQVVVVLPGSAERTLLGARTDLGVGTTVVADRAVSADLDLFDGSSVKVLGGASLELTRMEIGRFINQHSLVLTQSTGPIRYATGGPIDIIVPNGLVQLAAHGDYTIWLDGDFTRVLVYAGEARLSGVGNPLSVSDERQGVIDPQGIVSSRDRKMLLLTNGDFAQRDQEWTTFDKPNSALDVNGARLWVPGPTDGLSALRVVRDSVKGEHGETGLIHKLDKDVSGFRHLWLSAMVRVDFADLSGGGTLGSEYPMMLRLDYEGPGENTLNPWAVGFYYSNPDSRPVPEYLGLLWPQSEWQAYSVDLMSTETSKVPYRLLELTIMGQGHSYDARVANISLISD